MQNFIAQSMRRFGLAPENKSAASETSPSRISSIGNAPLSHMEVGSKWSYATLQYPLDIQSRTDLGHYMMFYVNIPTNSEYSTGGKRQGTFDKSADDKGDARGMPTREYTSPAQRAVMKSQYSFIYKRTLTCLKKECILSL